MNVIEAAARLQIWFSGIDRADDAAIRKAWREAASRWHPDKGGDTQAMQRINAAKDYLLSMSQASRAAPAGAMIKRYF